MTPCSRLTLLAVLCFVMMACVLRAAETAQSQSLSDDLADRIVSVTQGWGEVGLNVSAATEGQKPLKLRIKDKEYAHGLGHHANGEIAIELGGQFKTFQTEIGVLWQGGQTVGSVIFQIYVDGKRVYDSGVVHENDAPRPVTVSVENAKELRLVAGDAGDGITCDCAVWADARLTRNPAAGPERRESAIDVAPFAVVVSWNPEVMTGTKASRVQEFPAEDIAPYQEIVPDPAGVYSVPTTNGKGCIGLQWLENRLLRRVALRFGSEADVPAAGSVELQYWTGASAWQGQWQRSGIAAKKEGSSLVWSLGFQQMPRGTQKVRWVIKDAGKPITVAGISAFTRSRCETIDVQIEATHYVSDFSKDLDIPVALDWAPKAEITLYNGDFESKQSLPHHYTWEKSKPLPLKVRYSVPQRYKADRTVLRFQMKGVEANAPGAAFGVAIEDLLNNDCVYVPHAGVFVTRSPAPVTLENYLKKIADQKSVLQQVREKPDQDFARAWQVVHNPVQDYGPMMLSLANDNRKYTVGREGTIWFDQFDWQDYARGKRYGTIYEISFTQPWVCTSSFGVGQPSKVTRHLQGQWLPIPVTTTTVGPIEYRQATCVAPASDATAKTPSWFRDRAVCVAEYSAKNVTTAAAPARMSVGLGNSKNIPIQLQDVKEGVLVVQGDRIVALIDTRKATPLTAKREGNNVVMTGELAGGATAECVVYLPGWKADPKDYASLLQVSPAADRVASYWTALLQPAMQIEIPDQHLSNIIRASQVHCMMAARNENGGDLVSAWTAASLYGPLESESNSVIRGMDMNGQSDFARRSLDHLLTYQTKEGFITTGYTIVGTGEVLWTLAEHYGRTRDRGWGKKVAPQVARVCQWIMRQREKTKRLDARGQKVPEYGLMTPGVSADWDRYAYRLFNDAQYCAGLAAGGRMLADIGDPAAAAVCKDAERYRRDIVRAYRWVQARSPVVKLANGTWAPNDPMMMNCFGRIEESLPAEDADRTWGYSVDLGAHHLAATRVLDPRSPEADWTVDNCEDVQFLRNGWGDYPEERNRADIFSLGGFAKLQPYYCRIAELHAMRDDVKPFIRSYFNTIPTLVSNEILSFWEHLANRGAWNKTHETGWFLCQTRIMFVGERGDELWLAPFVPNHWLKDGLKVSIRNAPTRFGKVGYTIASKAADGAIEAVVQLPEKCTAKKIVLRLRHPDGKPIRSVTVQGKPHTNFDQKQETVTLEPSGKSIAVRAEY
jgi:hypothetical protein